MSEIDLPDGSCTFTANVIGTQLLFRLPDSSQQSGGAEIMLENNVQYIPVYIEEGQPDVVSSYVINDSQLPLLNQTRQIILTEDQIMTLDHVPASDLEHTEFPSQILTLDSEESKHQPDRAGTCGIDVGQKTAAVLLQKDDVTLAEGTITVRPVFPPVVADDIVDPPDKTCPDVCDVCGLRFESRKLFRKHILSHLHDKPFKCPHCPESFNHEYNYIPHVATHNEKDPYCPVCNKRFSRLAGLKAHILIHQCDDTLPCPECLEEFSTHKLLEAHRLEHKSGFVKQPIRMHHCSNCDEKFATKAFLKEHVLEVHKLKMPKKVRRGKGGYVCEYCKKRFEKPSQLVRHKRTHTGEKPFKCAECGKGFGQKGSLQIHMLKHSGLKPYACKYCSSQFSQKGNLQAHIQRIHPDEKDEVRKLHCKHCSCVFRNIVSLHSHMSRNHGIYFTSKKGKPIAYEIIRQGDTITAEISPDTDSSNKENEAKGDESDARATDSDATSQKAENDPEWKNESLGVINKCKHCSKVFKKRADLVKHLKSHSEDSTKSEFLCGACGRYFPDETVFQTHLQTAHPEMLEFACDLCPSKFAVLEDLKIHRRSVHEEQYRCRTCNVVFESADFKQLHEAQHAVEAAEPEPPEPSIPVTSAVIYQEDNLLECTKVFIAADGTIKLIRDDEVVEENRAPAVTDACVETEPEVFAQEVIEEPTREAEDETRKFKCDHCSQSFKKISHYKAHLRIHTGEKPFSCEKCHKLFAAKSALTIHMGSHEEVPSFACDDCGKTFSSHRSLKRHMELHAPGFPYTCSVCSRVYKTKVAWQKHVSTHLKIPEQQDAPEKVDEVVQSAQTGVEEPQYIEIIQTKSAGDVVGITENKKDAASSACFQGDWTDLIQSLQPGQQFSFNGSQSYTAVAASSSPIKTTTATSSTTSTRQSSSPITVQFDGFGEKNNLFTPLNDQAFDGCVFLQSSDNLQTTNLTLPVTAPTEVPAQPQVNTHRCSLCNVSFDNLVELSIHKTTHLQEKWATCPTCNKTFSSSQEYQAHTKDCLPTPSDHHPAPPQGEYTVRFDVFSSELQKCNNCNLHFFQLSDYTQHVASQHGAFACKFCSVWFKAEDQLQAHQLTHKQMNKSELKHPKSELRIKVDPAPVIQPSPAKVSVVPVDVDPSGADGGEKKPGTSREKLEMKRKRAAWRRQAVRTLTEEEQLAITKESPSSISERILQQSILRLKRSPKREETEREQDYPNKCKYCPKSFRKPSDLVRHLRVHTGERPYTCSSCNKSFSIKSTAKSHVKIHKKERAYKCHLCDNSFAAVGSLKVHMRLHTGAKPFACELCPAKFRTSGHRKSHMFSHMRKDVAKEKEERERMLLSGSSTPPVKSQDPLEPPPPSVNFLNKLAEPQEDRPEDLLDKIVPEKDPLSDPLEQLKKPLSNSQFLFSLDAPLGFGDRTGESSAGSQQFFLKEIKGDDQAGTAAHFVVTMGDDINYSENINDLLESVPALSEDQDKFDLDLDLPKEQLSVRVCESCTACGKVFASCMDLESHMKKEHFVSSSLSCNVCKQTFTAKADLELHNLVHELDHLSCHGCSLGFPNEAALRKHKCTNEDSNLKAMPSSSLDLASVVNEFFSFPAL